ncbi:MAG: thiamine phosphate synthase [Nitrospinae bacterium]|nr:thiamine phosphate synthase [Nitrospinota bacterium]
MRTSQNNGLDFLHVYLISDFSHHQSIPITEQVEKALQGGVRALQLREKDLSPKELLAQALEIKPVIEKYDAKLFINDRADIAEIAGADGVHLTEASVPAGEVKDKFPNLIVGVSTHAKEGALLAEAEGADFITFSPIYETPSKIHFGPPQGPERLGEIVKSVHLPVLALGGIKLNRVPEVLEQGAHGVAVISGIWDSKDIKQQASKYMHHFGGVTS